MSLTTAVVLAMSLKVPDAKGHMNYRAIPRDGADAIVKVCGKTSAPTHCAAVLSTLAFRESNNNPLADHDNHKGCGAFGALCTYPHGTWLEQVETAWKLVLESTLACKEPLAKYASGSCGYGLSIAKEYMRIARKIAGEFQDQVEH